MSYNETRSYTSKTKVVATHQDPVLQTEAFRSVTNPHHLSKCQFCLLTHGLDNRRNSHITTGLPCDRINTSAEKIQPFVRKAS